MKTKTITTIVLFIIIAAGITYFAVESFGSGPKTEKETTNSSTINPEANDLKPITVAKTGENSIVVYYFHGNFRCITCRTIEAYTREAITSGFSEELKDGSLKLLVLNIQEPENRGYIKDFQLEYYVVVLEKIVDGKRQEWKKLDDVWELVNNKQAFIKYVQGETRNYLKGIEK